jgi:hypothetical protein
MMLLIFLLSLIVASVFVCVILYTSISNKQKDEEEYLRRLKEFNRKKDDDKRDL